ncbi:hypothetical protein PXO_03418 [Xanthomonas oryzae pv. oryzae PXO99A]|uniref:Uncharacterized protein n=1 Tax=Xanthomonas oryzae pv. oryzae (strain PXO99A) TaxID=360094 RepID=A0A0K0GF92_XANOP|nr:hypothetical protein PXO_03418 [Xanthomonas oryzae pv. oryzae PXO99A]
MPPALVLGKVSVEATPVGRHDVLQHHADVLRYRLPTFV